MRKTIIDRTVVLEIRQEQANMATIEVTKADVLRAIQTERDWWRAVVDLAEANSPVTGNEPVTGTWTYREIIGHVSGWRRWTVARLEAAADGSSPIPPWPDGMAEDSLAGVDEINAWFLQQSRSTSLDDTIDEAFALIDRMRDAVEQIPEDRLVTPGAFIDIDPELADDPIYAIVGFSLMHVHLEHGPELQAWLSERLGQHAELPPTPSYLGYEE